MAKKRRISLQKSINRILNLVPEKDAVMRLRELGLSDREINNGAVVMAALFSKAASGDNTAIKTVLDISEDGDTNCKRALSRLYRALESEEKCD